MSSTNPKYTHIISTVTWWEGFNLILTEYIERSPAVDQRMFPNLAKAIEVHFRHLTMIDVRMHRASEVEKVGIAFPSQMKAFWYGFLQLRKRFNC